MAIYDKEELDEIKQRRKTWENTLLKGEIEKRGKWKKEFKTNSGIPMERLYTPLDLNEKEWSYPEKLGFPGDYPFTRGITPTMYRGVPPRMFVYSGYGSAELTNQRYKYLLSQGAKELIIASDLPTQLGYDSDNPLSRGEVGKIGVAINSLADVEVIFDGIRLDEVFVGAQANANSPILLAFVIAAAEKQGVSPQQIKFVVQNDVLKEYIARGTYIFPPKPALKFSCDIIEYVARNNLSEWMCPIIYCGYHMREAGANTVQEMAFTMANAVAYIEEVLSRDINIDELPQQRALFVAGLDLFEEVCKHRAFRRLWAKMMKERFKAKNPRVMALGYTCGSQSSLYTAQQPMNNIVRGTISGLVQALSGVQTMNIAAMDEALSIPTEESATIVLRTMQIITHETGIPNTIDPLAGSYYVETLTDELEERATRLFEKVQSLGGAVACIEQGFQEAEIAKEAYEQYKQVKIGGRVWVGVNQFQMDEKLSIKLMRVDPKEEERQIEKVKRLRKERDNKKVRAALKDLKEAAIEETNLVPTILSAVKVYSTIGEICNSLREVYGEYRRPAY
jgi:methylmalonyl-CoA mutase N-terminal domain/subunit